MALPGTGGAIGITTVIEAAEREASKADNRKKLLAAGTSDRYLAVYVSVLTPAWVPLMHLRPAPVLPTLPPEITGLWMFSESGVENEYVVWSAGASRPWTKQRLIVT
jgi:hypothetical protein